MTPRKRSVSWGWKVPVLWTLEPKSQTFGELWSKLPGITPKALSETLRELQTSGLIAHHATENAEMEYALTDAGATAMPDIHNIVEAIVNNAASHAKPEQFLHLQELFTGITRRPRPLSSADAIRRAANEIRRLIETGAFLPGERLPSADKIASLMSLTLSQAQQVYDHLKEDGVVNTRRRKGTFVPEPTATAHPLTQKTPNSRAAP